VQALSSAPKWLDDRRDIFAPASTSLSPVSMDNENKVDNAEARHWFPRAGFFVSRLMVGAAGFEPTTPSPQDRIKSFYINIGFHICEAF
jgi:hypothetical protein